MTQPNLRYASWYIKPGTKKRGRMYKESQSSWLVCTPGLLVRNNDPKYKTIRKLDRTKKPKQLSKFKPIIRKWFSSHVYQHIQDERIPTTAGNWYSQYDLDIFVHMHIQDQPSRHEYAVFVFYVKIKPIMAEQQHVLYALADGN